MSDKALEHYTKQLVSSLRAGPLLQHAGFAECVVTAIDDLITYRLTEAKKQWLRTAGVVESTDP